MQLIRYITELGAGDIPRITVWNKVDAMGRVVCSFARRPLVSPVRVNQ
jgi:50S ribosomal subunit-associated GTPase HflX